MATTCAVAIAVLAGLCAAALPASAAFTNVERVSVASAQTSAAKSITVTCPAGKKVMSAGADATPGSGDVLIDDIRPDATLSSVTVRAIEDETGTTATWYVAAYAICAPPPAGLVRVAATSPSTSAGKSVTAACPAGKKVVGTGAEVNGADGQILLDGIRPTLDLTKVTVNALEDQTQTAASWTVTAYAICSAPVTGLQRVAATTASDSTGSRVGEVACPAHKVLVGLGGEINSAYGQGVLDAVFPDAALETAGFAAWEDDTGNPNSWSLTTYAICAARVYRVAGAQTADSGVDHATGVGCPQGMSLTGAGGELTDALGRAWMGHIDPNDPSPSGAPGAEVVTAGRTADPWVFVAYGMCATAIPSLTTVQQQAGAIGRQQSAIATCPEGKRVIGTGNRATYAAKLMLQGIVPSADLRSAMALEAQRPDSDAAWSVTAMAICATPPPGLQLVTRTSATDLEEVKTAVATCPAGKHLLGTGARVTPAEGWVILDDVRPNEALTSVTATGIHDPTRGNDPWSVSAYAICVNR
jgi:hypothetical protein